MSVITGDEEKGVIQGEAEKNSGGVGIESLNSQANGQIVPDSPAGRLLGFTSDKFDGWLWVDGDRMWISFIVSRQEGKGHLSQLFDAIETHGFYVAVPTPFPRMEAILKRKGFVPYSEISELGDPVEVWLKPQLNDGRLLARSLVTTVSKDRDGEC